MRGVSGSRRGAGGVLARSRHARLGGASVVLALAVGLAAPAAGATPVPAAPPSSAGGLQVLGPLAEPSRNAVYGGTGGYITAVDAVRRRMYYVYPTPTGLSDIRLRAFDLRPALPSVLWDVAMPGLSSAEVSPYTTVLDTRRDRLAFLQPGSAPPVGANTATAQVDTTITIVDLAQRRVVTAWDLAKTVPGFNPEGLTYSASDDRYYLVGEMDGSYLVANGAATFGKKPADLVPTVVALDASTGALAWVRPVPQCQQVLNTLAVGALIAHDRAQSALYFACDTGGSGAVVEQTFPGEAGLVRLDISPTASGAAAWGFPVAFFPVSGDYFNGAEDGIAAWDPVTDRFFVQSMAPATPGDWVFDAHLSSWVGFVPAADSADYWIGFNPGLGHLYLGGTNASTSAGDPGDGLVVADTRLTPLPAGAVFHLIPFGFIATDPGSRRLFLPTALPGSGRITYLVVADNAPSPVQPTPLDYDALTANRPERAGDYVSYAGGVDGYGAEAVLVGGAGGLLSGALPGQSLPVAPGTRALVAARLPAVNLSPSGASGTAQALEADINTASDYADSGAKQPWPYPPVTCLDTGSGMPAQQSTGPQARASVLCALASDRVLASTGYGQLQLASAPDGLSVGSSSITTSVTRSFSTGITTVTTAEANGVRVGLPGGGSLSISHVTSTATTEAHGYHGTALARWQRSLDGVVVFSAAGAPEYYSPGCTDSLSAGGTTASAATDTCQPVLAALDSLVGEWVHLALPVPQLTATPHGAFADVRQSDAAYYQERTLNDQGVIFPADSVAARPTPALQLEVFTDSTDRSRTVLQLAAVEASSIFDVSSSAGSLAGLASAPSAAGQPSPGASLPGSRPGVAGRRYLVYGPRSSSAGSGASSAASPYAGSVRVHGLALVVRTAGDAALTALLLLLAVGTLVLLARRGELVRGLT